MIFIIIISKIYHLRINSPKRAYQCIFYFRRNAIKPRSSSRKVLENNCIFCASRSIYRSAYLTYVVVFHFKIFKYGLDFVGLCHASRVPWFTVSFFITRRICRSYKGITYIIIYKRSVTSINLPPLFLAVVLITIYECNIIVMYE